MADQSQVDVQAESLEYRTEVKQLLDILAHSLYTDRDIFLRELISNASDALNRVQFEMLTNSDVVGADAELAITLEIDEDEKRISIRDTGIGMNREDLIQNLGTIAHSGAKSFLSNAANGNGDKPTNIAEIIGQFGVGFYSAFMVASEITVTSRSHRPEDQAWAWRSNGDSQFTLTPAEQAERGTTIDIQLKADAEEYASKWKLESIIRKHSDYVSFPIFVTVVEKPTENEEDEAAADAEIEVGESGDEASDAEEDVVEVKPDPTPVNKQTAIWRQSASDVKADEYEEFYKQLTYDFNSPLAHIHLVTDAPADIRSILFIPSKRERGMMGMQAAEGLKLYSRKVLIQEENKDLLPEYYRFVAGVIDSEDLPLNVSRETVQSNPLIRQIKKALTNRVNRELKRMADKDPATYATFWEEFGMFIKEGVATDPSSHDTLLDMLRFHSSQSLQLAEAAGSTEETPEENASPEGEASEESTESTDGESGTTDDTESSETKVDTSGLTSLQAYVDRMQEDQEDIYYVLGEELQSVKLSPHLDYFRANDIEVLYLVDPIDGYMTSMLRDFKGKSLKNVDDASLDLPENSKGEDKKEETPLEESDFEKLTSRVKEVLGDRITDVAESKQLVNSPCRLVTPEGSMDRDLQRIMRLTQQDYAMPKKLLELNRSHPVVTNLSQILESNPEDTLIDATIEQLFGNAVLLEGAHPNPSEMVAHIQTIMEAAVAGRAK
ncbi:MAG: molecular chaperone HtpG [Chloroflexota bacterium]